MGLAVLFLVLAIIAGLMGFGLIAGVAFAVAKLLFFIFLVIFVVLLVLGLMAGRRV